ncbi:MAG TPA: response regulator transcription factor [Bryobacteraceae bacterium]
MTRGKRTHKILLADAHLLFRRGLRTLLSAESDLDVVGEASDVAEALGTARQVMPNVLVMDLALLHSDGEQGPLAIRQIDSSTGVLFLTQEDSPEQLELAIAAGARGYMLKNSPPRQLLAGIRQIAISDDHNPRSLSRLVPDLQALALNNRNTRASVLTLREQEVMRLLAEGRTVREVASELSLSIKTIEAHKLNLMRKLDIHNRSSLVEYAVRAGLIQPQPVQVG